VIFLNLKGRVKKLNILENKNKKMLLLKWLVKNDYIDLEKK